MYTKSLIQLSTALDELKTVALWLEILQAIALTHSMLFPYGGQLLRMLILPAFHTFAFVKIKWLHVAN